MSDVRTGFTPDPGRATPPNGMSPPPPEHGLPLPAARRTPDGVRVLTGVPYAAVPGVRPLELDLYLPPAGAGCVPAVVFLHGGGWRMGSRRSAGPAFATADTTPFEQLAGTGIAVASVDYRLSGEALWPAPLHDAKAAVRWLRWRASDLGIDQHAIAAWGESAGGHLAELLGLTGDRRDLDGDAGIIGHDSTVAAVVAWYAPSDLAGVARDAGLDPASRDSREAQLLGAPPVEVAGRAAAASPISYVAATAPPMLLLHGRADRLIPCAQSERLHAALTAAGASCELQLYDDVGHLWLGSVEAANDALRRTIDFLHHHLDSDGEGT